MMCDAVGWVAAGTAVVLIAEILYGLVLFARFLRLLRERHAGVWQDLAQPGLIASEGERSDRLVSVFIVRGQYKKLNDARLSWIGDALRFMFFVVGATVLVLIVAYAKSPNLRFAGLECIFGW
jgi:hypothetical protein